MIQLKPCTLDDVQQLQSISIETYTDTFGPFNPPHIMKAYLDDAYPLAKLRRELATTGTTFYFLYDEDELAGYLKVNTGQAQTEDIAENTLEIERLYIRTAYKRRGHGRFLIDYACQLATQNGQSSVWLGVWEHNEPAKAFYQQMGFVRQGQHSFFMGDDEQTDYIMIKQLI
uniref:GNAT family N-acetyltransferase n=1 Tax=Candidatus Enterococcus willemsii TaxID=1857215 RepID=UPI00403EFDB2